ncbi:26S proteasome non-ATPase regulatory subunit (macronuclear) [Tetrahymena thermophila SB210]|uniref:26S proteasome non-ATPase regulatory subunit n=1 Tax=Tetrahymena thermophila (strain SB210) TaxID=312017 RepID=Q23FC0_TETTS|nr:26S proteasome non-ATPase regulatory subunit [Tetrahymena thermophila SB210]EAR95233.3 26S proteasome non-ATPase regulatory subunit [Tetrahymena thermophila SB210]|eukprot:XP_001015478.3 26S proteasome non-ATPase regulatory subunit [Tetrahymena thermophila SB210]
MTSVLDRLEQEANALKSSQAPQVYENALYKIIEEDVKETDDNFRIKENAFYNLVEHFKSLNQPVKIKDLIYNRINDINAFPKAKAAKVIRTIIEVVATIEKTEDIQIELCNFLVEWCQKQGITYLRHRIEIKLSVLYLQRGDYTKALTIIEAILKETRKADDKHMLVEGQLIESKIHYALENYAKAKASLTASRACSNSIYCAPALQADIDMMTGILQCEDKDYKTAYSYFYEGFEALNSLDDPRSIKALKYMLLCKIMTSNYDDIAQILNGKYGLKYAGKDLDAMKLVAKAYREKSLSQFQALLQTYAEQITGDPIIKNQLNQLYDQLLEQNLFRLIEPYTRVQITHIAQRIGLDENLIQKKLSELILDKKIDGTLDQGTGCLILFDDIKCDDLYKNAVEHNQQMEKVVEKLFEKAKLLKN